MAKGGFLTGAIWSSLNAAAGIGLPLVIFILFARVLVPEQVGIVALTIAWGEIIKTFGFTGLYEALLQQKDDRARCHETAALVFLVCGALLVLPFLAVLWATSLSIPGVHQHFWLLALIGLRIPMDLAALQPQARLAQELAYKQLGIRSIIGNLLAGTAGVGIAFLGDPLTGLVVYQVGQSALVMAVTLASHTAARPRAHLDCFRRMAREAVMATTVRIVAVSNNQADQVIVAGLLGSSQMAYYNLGKRLETAFTAVSSSFTSILFQPLFASRATGAREVALRRGLAFLTMTCGLTAAVFMANADAVIRLVFGAQWLPAAPLASILVINGFLRALGGVHGSLMSVSGQNRSLLVISGSLSIVGIAATVVTAPIGLVWCAATMTLKTAIALVWGVHAIRSEFVHPMRAYFVEVFAPFALMLLGAAAGHWLAMVALPASIADASGVLQTLAVVGVSGVAGALGCGIYFGHRFAGLMKSMRRSPLRRA
jgi:O-antigen/teichoic acid export membrane protein